MAILAKRTFPTQPTASKEMVVIFASRCQSKIYLTTTLGVVPQTMEWLMGITIAGALAERLRLKSLNAAIGFLNDERLFPSWRYRRDCGSGIRQIR
jgi:hypothetical protein